MAAARRCRQGHQLPAGAGASAPCRVCRHASIVAVVAAACPELSAGAVSAALDATITSPAVSHDLVVALAAGPDVVRAGAPPVVARLVGELRARGSVLPVPACAICGRSGLELIRSGTVGLCGRCRSHERAEACSTCGRKRVVVGRAGGGGALCFACAPRPARVCGRCGRVATDRPTSPGSRARCLQQLLPTAGGHLRELRAAQAVQLRGRRDADLCLLFAPGDLGMRPLRRLRPPAARWRGRSSVRAVLSRRPVSTGGLQGCGNQLVWCSRPVPGRLCARLRRGGTAGSMLELGIEDRLYKNGRCVHCALAERAASLLGGPRPDLGGVYDADRRRPPALLRPQLAPLRRCGATSSLISPRVTWRPDPRSS